MKFTIAILSGLTGLAWAAQAEQSEVYHTQPQVQFMAFGDLLLQQGDVAESGLQLGQLIGQVSASLDQRTRVFSEISLNEKDGTYSVTVERLIVRYEFNDKFKLSAGKYHSPIGYWNETYHHGTWLQNSVFRPHVLRFGSPIMPIHFRGVLLEGDLYQGASQYGYKIGFGQGLHNNLAGDHHNNIVTGENAINLAFYHRPASLPWVKYGLGYYQDTFTLENEVPGNALNVDKQIFSAYVVTDTNPTLIAEAIHYSHDVDSTDKKHSAGNGYYVQLEHRLSGDWHSLLPFARWDKVSADVDDVVFNSDENYQALTLGLRYDLSDYIALKGQIENVRRGAEDLDEQRLSLQLSFVIP